MKVIIFFVVFLSLAMGCSYKEEFYVNDDQCGKDALQPDDTKIVRRFKENKCIRLDGVYGIITKCTYARLDFSLYDDDPRCGGKPVDKWAYIDKQCTYSYNYDGERIYTKITMIEEIEEEPENEKAIKIFGLWSTLTIFAAMVVINL